MDGFLFDQTRFLQYHERLYIFSQETLFALVTFSRMIL